MKYIAEGIFDMNTSHLYIDDKLLDYNKLLGKTMDMYPDINEVRKTIYLECGKLYKDNY
jgi:hypothetical protein